MRANEKSELRKKILEGITICLVMLFRYICHSYLLYMQVFLNGTYFSVCCKYELPDPRSLISWYYQFFT